MKKVLAAALVAVGTLAVTSSSMAQSVVVNEFRNGTPDAVELLVITDNLDMRGLIIKDFSSSGSNDNGRAYTFTTNSLWGAVKAGTFVVLRNDATAADTSAGGTDFNLDVGLQNTAYFTASAGTFDIATEEIILLKSAGSVTQGLAGAVHALATANVLGTNYAAIANPKLRASTGNSGTGESVEAQNSLGLLTDFDGTDAMGDRATGSIGTWNTASNQAYVISLRGAAPTNQPPVIQTIGNKITTNGIALAFNVIADDTTDNDTITLTASNLPGSATFPDVSNATSVTGAFSWASATPPGVYTTSFYAIDNDGVSTSTITITVLDPPSISITTAPSTEPYSTTSIQIDGTASSNVVGDILWTNAAGAVGGSIAAATTWSIPSVSLGVGANTITVRGSNSVGQVATSSVVITRSQPPVPGCSDLISSQGFEGGDPWTLLDGSANISSDPGATDAPENQRIASGTASWQVNNSLATAELASVSISGYTGRYVRLRVTGVATNTGTTGVDAGDTVAVFVALDGAAFGSSADVTLTGNNNARWGFWATNAYVAVAGSSLTVSAPQGSLSTNNYSTLYVLLPDSATSVAVRVTASNNSANEVWNVDDIAVVGCSAGPPPADSDGDGILDTWELSFFGSLTNASATSDSDGDRFIDQHEFRANTLPNDTNSLLVATALQSTSGGLLIRWQSATGEVYMVSKTTNLVSGVYSIVESNLLATPMLNVYTVAVPESAASYRVQLQE